MNTQIELNQEVIYDVRNIKLFTSINGIIGEYISEDARNRVGIALVLSYFELPNYFENIDFIGFTEDYGWRKVENAVDTIDAITLFTDYELKFYEEYDFLYNKFSINDSDVIKNEDYYKGLLDFAEKNNLNTFLKEFRSKSNK